MFTCFRQHRILPLVALALVIANLGGCALNRLPRIDPSGRQLLEFPDQPTALASNGAPILPGTAPANVPLAAPNAVAQPVFTDTFLPGTPGATQTTDLLGRPVIIGAPVSTSIGATTTGGPIAVAAQPPERISITPSRILAPVGSEVILRGGVCAESGYLLTNERIEWLLDRKGVGQIIEVGNAWELDILRLPRNTPRKVDNYFAIGATSPFEQCIDRGTPDPNDDVQVRRGDSWLSIASATEGTSYVTAYAPKVENWAGRTAAATIYWVDAQWTFPPPVTLAPGQSHTLTTTITRQSDGAPIAGWIVRYRAEGGAAGLGYEGGQTSEATTNAQGRASIEITPTDNQPGVTNIAIEIIRPEQAGVAASPRVTLGTGATSITWAQGGIAGSPLPVESPPALPPAGFPGTGAGPLPPPATPPTTPPMGPTPAPEPTPAAQPDLVVQIEQRSPGPFRVGDSVDFLVTVINQGEGTARNVKIVDYFDPGLSNPAAAPGEQFIKSDTPFDLASGESQSLPLLTFGISQPGRLSHNVEVTADNTIPVNERAFITVEANAPVGPASLNVQIDGPDRHNVGEAALFRIKVTNTGTTPAVNVQITNDRDPELRPAATDPDHPYDRDLFMQTGQVRWPIGQLAPGQSVTREIECLCVTSAGGQGACSRAEAIADGMVAPVTARKCVEIRQPLGGAQPDLGNQPLAGGQGLDISLSTQAVPRVQNRFLLYADLRNNTGAAQQNVRMRILIPAEFEADLTQLQTAMPVQTQPGYNNGLEIQFGPLPQMPAGATESIVIPLTPVREANVQVFAERTADGLEKKVISRDITIVGR